VILIITVCTNTPASQALCIFPSRA
jgi:hypothetical protein